MGRLAHNTKAGWTYFVTTKSFQSTFLFQVQQTAEIIVAKILEYRDRQNYLLHDFVLMPNHLHLILTPAPGVSLEKAMQLMKGGSSHEIHRARGNKMEIWQAGFHESSVTSWSEYQKKRDYVQYNPVAAKLVDKAEEWVYGSASGRFVPDPIPRGLKPLSGDVLDVGPKGPTPGAFTAMISTESTESVSATVTQGLKSLRPKETEKIEELKGGTRVVRTDGAATESATTSEVVGKVAKA
jgi:putative transposase